MARPKSQARRAPRSGRLPRCCYREDGRQCVRNGEGNPPLCHPHRLVLEAGHDRGPERPIGDVLGDVIRGRRVSTDDLLGAVFGFATAAFGRGGAGAVPHGGAPGNGNGHGSRPAWHDAALHGLGGARNPVRPPPGPSPEEMALQRSLLLARQELGFQPREPIARVDVEQRRKQLARRHHPDLGGSVARMASINQAADLLLEKGNLG